MLPSCKHTINDTKGLGPVVQKPIRAKAIPIYVFSCPTDRKTLFLNLIHQKVNKFSFKNILRSVSFIFTVGMKCNQFYLYLYTKEWKNQIASNYT